jgi:hypothetical protein
MRGCGYFTELSRTMRADFDKLDICSIYFVCVTKTSRVQESEYRAGAFPCGLILDKYENYVNDGLQTGLQLLVMSRPVKKRVVEKLFLPPEIETEARDLYASMGIALSDIPARYLAAPIRASIDIYNSNEYFSRLSRDYDKTRHINLYLNMLDEDCPENYENAKEKGFFFTGFKPLQTDAEYIIMHRPPCPSRFFEALAEAQTLDAFAPLRAKITKLAEENFAESERHIV